MPPQQSAPPPGRQQRFDEATNAAAERRCAEAVELFTALEKEIRSGMGLAALRVRKGVCLAELNRGDEAAPLLRAGMPALAAKGDAFANDLRDAHLALGRLDLLKLDYDAAASHFRDALARSVPENRIVPLNLLIRATSFDKGPEPLAHADQMLALLKAQPGSDKESVAAAHTLRARVLMNQGHNEEAYAELTTALALQGGLGFKVSLSDVVTRGDLALAALLLNKRDDARKYLAYTGAGRTEKSFERATDMSPPLCGAEGLKREDFAVIQFHLADDGSVSSVTPIYTTGGREVALTFARAVSQWSWTPEAAKAIPAFHRIAARVEMRCTTVGDLPGYLDPIAATLTQWLGDSFAEPADDLSQARAVPLVRAAAAKAEAAGDRKALLGALAWLSTRWTLPEEERIAALDRARTLAAETGAPAPARTLLAIWRLGAGTPGKQRSERAYRDQLRALLATPEVAGDPLSAATLRLMTAAPRYRLAAAEDADALLAAVTDDSRLPANHPLKVNALLQRANVAARQGDLDLAQRYFEQTGLTEQQCALIGVAPAVKRTGLGGNDFPQEALAMGFEGWVQLEFDVSAQGTTIAPRAIVAYPPMVFTDAATGMARNMRYQASYRPAGGPACAGNRANLRFDIDR